MLALTDYSWTLADAILRGEAVVLPADGLDIALHNAAPNANCLNDELTAADYVRLHIDVASWGPSTQGVCDLLTQIDWQPAAEDWGQIKGISLWDEDRPWFRAELLSAKLIVTGATFHIAASDLRAGVQ